MPTTENTNHELQKIRCEVASLRGQIMGMKWGIEFLKDELRRVTEERDALMLKKSRRRA